jgi:hypothetical protein
MAATVSGSGGGWPRNIMSIGSPGTKARIKKINVNTPMTTGMTKRRRRMR